MLLVFSSVTGSPAASDVDIFGYYREGQKLALQLFTMREGNIVGRREFFWEDLPEDDSFDAGEFLGEDHVHVGPSQDEGQRDRAAAAA